MVINENIKSPNSKANFRNIVLKDLVTAINSTHNLHIHNLQSTQIKVYLSLQISKHSNLLAEKFVH